MVFFNYSTMQMAAKVVYYGPGLCGKTTNLQWIFEHTSTDSRGEMVSLATETDRTLFFDLLPIDVGTIAGFNTRIQLYTVPGQVFYNTTRKLVLKGVDGVVFVADSQAPMLQANIDSFANLEENLGEMGLSLETIPVVLQFNKRDLPNVLSVEELNEALNRAEWPWAEASAINGTGVFETLKLVSKATLLALKKRLTKGRSEPSAAGRPAAPPPGRPPFPKAPLKPPLPPKPSAPTKPPLPRMPVAPPLRTKAAEGFPSPRPSIPLPKPPPSPGAASGSRPAVAGSKDPASSADDFDAGLPDAAPVDLEPVEAELPSTEAAAPSEPAEEAPAGEGAEIEPAAVVEPALAELPEPEVSLAEPEVGVAEESAATEPEAVEPSGTPAVGAEPPALEPTPNRSPLPVGPMPVAPPPAKPPLPPEPALPEPVVLPEVAEPAAVEPAAGEPAAGEPAAGEPAAGEPAAGEPEIAAVETMKPAAVESPAEASTSDVAAPEPGEPSPVRRPPLPEPLPVSTASSPSPAQPDPAPAPASPVAAPRVAAPAAPPVVAAAPAAALPPAAASAAPRPRKSRLGGIDALAELEKLRRQALHPRPGRASVRNGREIRREVEVCLAPDDFRRTHRFSLTLQLEDRDQQVVDEVRHVHVDFEDMSSLEELQLRFMIALNTKT